MLIPVNFLLSLVCLLLLVKRWRAGWLWRVLLLLCLAHSLNAGLSALPGAGGGIRLQPLTGAMLPVLCLLALYQQQGRALRYLLCSLTVLLMAAAVTLLPQAIDLLMPPIWLGSAALMLASLRTGSDALSAVTLEHSALTVRTWRLLALLLVGVALLDIIVSLLIDFGGGAGVPLLLTAGNLLACAALFLALVLTPTSPVVAEPELPRQPEAGDEETLACIEQLMRDGLYRRQDLNLTLLARRAGIPARRVSAAVNALRQQSVSQYVNGWRIREACERLSAKSGTVIEIMEEVGFQTKSNFNREFRRVCGTTPSEWRKARSEQAEITS